LEKNAQALLPDGRWRASWEKHRPRLYEIGSKGGALHHH
jgi:hypothetical protein